MVFPVVTYKCESWIIKNAECRRIEAFELWCWKRLFGEPPWTARRSNPLNPLEMNPEYSLEGLMLKPKLQYSDHLMWRADSLGKKLWCWERLNSGEEGGGGGLDSWMASLTQWTWVWANSGHSEGQGSLACCSPWGAKSWTWFSAWTTLCSTENSTQCSVVT